jgi:hypothetical protein
MEWLVGMQCNVAVVVMVLVQGREEGGNAKCNHRLKQTHQSNTSNAALRVYTTERTLTLHSSYSDVMNAITTTTTPLPAGGVRRLVFAV